MALRADPDRPDLALELHAREEREACEATRDDCSARAIRAARTPRPSEGTVAGYTLAGVVLDVVIGGGLLLGAISSTPSH